MSFSVLLRNSGAAQSAMNRAKVTLGKFEPRSAHAQGYKRKKGRFSSFNLLMRPFWLGIEQSF
jgi:hypothetical protein